MGFVWMFNLKCTVNVDLQNFDFMENYLNVCHV